MRCRAIVHHGGRGPADAKRILQCDLKRGPCSHSALGAQGLGGGTPTLFVKFSPLLLVFPEVSAALSHRRCGAAAG